MHLLLTCRHLTYFIVPICPNAIFFSDAKFKFKMDADLRMEITCTKINVPCDDEDMFEIAIDNDVVEEYCTNKYSMLDT